MKMSRLLVFLLSTIFVSCSSTKFISQVGDSYRFIVPSAPWYVELPGAKYVIVENKLADSTNGSAVLRFSGEEMSVSLSIGPALGFKSSIESRDHIDSLTASHFTRESVQKSQNSEAAFLEFDLTRMSDISIPVRHVYEADYVREKYKLTVVITTFHYRPQQHRPIFDEIIKGIQFVPNNTKALGVP